MRVKLGCGIGVSIKISRDYLVWVCAVFSYATNLQIFVDPNLSYRQVANRQRQDSQEAVKACECYTALRYKKYCWSVMQSPVFSFDNWIAVLTARLGHFIALIIKESCITASTEITDTPCFWVDEACGHLTGIYKAVYIGLVWRTSWGRGCPWNLFILKINFHSWKLKIDKMRKLNVYSRHKIATEKWFLH